MQIQTDRPVNGGSLLAEASFPDNSFTGGRLGADFLNPIALTAGHTYFVDFLNVGGMGTDFGQFAIAPDGTHIPSAGATTRLGAFYTDPPGSTAFIAEFAGNAGDRTLPTGNGSALEPILYFDGSTGGGPTAVTPEPSTAVLMLMGLGGAFVLRHRHRRAASQFGGTDRQQNGSRLPAAMKRFVPWTLLLLATAAGCGSSSAAPSADKGRDALESLLDSAGLELVSFSKEHGQASIKDGVDHYRMHIIAHVKSKMGIAEIISQEKNKRVTGWLDFEKRESGWQLSDSNWQ